MSSDVLPGLPFLRCDCGSIALRDDRTITRSEFLAEIAELAGRLPDCPYVVNFCSDRYRFTVTWAAAMLRQQVTLLPSGCDAGAVAALRADYPALYVLTDDAKALPDGWIAYPKLSGTGVGHRVPAFPAEQIAAVLFTSGSTGRPQPSVRRWGRLVRGSAAAGSALGLDRFPGAAVVATVPHAHSYGLESTIMLPLQHGLLLTSGRPFFPADVTAALGASLRRSILVTAPVHLRALTGDIDPGFVVATPAALVLSATAPLSADLAVRAETVFSAPVYEIYGCSEAGQIATRRTIEGLSWRCLDGFGLRQDHAGTWVSGPAEDDVLLADEIQLSDQGFILQGRTADMVNVAGKRSSLAYLTHHLLAIDGVEDGAFFMPEQPAVDASPRLAAVAVAPGLDTKTLLAALRDQIDPAFLPRPLLIVETMPRNALGKVSRADLVCLERTTAAPPLVLRFPLNHPAGPGHFPGNPIIPGAAVLDELVAALFPGDWSGCIEVAKFHRPIRPGDAVDVAHRTEGCSTRFECRLVGSDRLVLSGALRSTFPSR